MLQGLDYEHNPKIHLEKRCFPCSQKHSILMTSTNSLKITKKKKTFEPSCLSMSFCDKCFKSLTFSSIQATKQVHIQMQAHTHTQEVTTIFRLSFHFKHFEIKCFEAYVVHFVAKDNKEKKKEKLTKPTTKSNSKKETTNTREALLRLQVKLSPFVSYYFVHFKIFLFFFL